MDMKNLVKMYLEDMAIVASAATAGFLEEKQGSSTYLTNLLKFGPPAASSIFYAGVEYGMEKSADYLEKVLENYEKNGYKAPEDKTLSPALRKSSIYAAEALVSYYIGRTLSKLL